MYTEQKQAAQSERLAIQTLGLDKHKKGSALVECSLVKICISIGHARELEIDEGHYDAVKIPDL